MVLSICMVINGCGHSLANSVADLVGDGWYRTTSSQVLDYLTPELTTDRGAIDPKRAPEAASARKLLATYSGEVMIQIVFSNGFDPEHFVRVAVLDRCRAGS